MKDNQLIAEFMGVKPDKNWHSGTWYIGQELKDAGLPFSPGIHGNGTHEPPFESSWDWLMPVIQRILDLGIVIDDMELFYVIRDGIPNINDTHKLVVEFIKWYNITGKNNTLD